MRHIPVTLVVIAGWPEPTEVAVRDTLAQFSFDAAITFGSHPIAGTRWIDTTITCALDAAVVRTFRVLPHVKTSHVLFIDWDGYPVRQDVWEDAFLEYDYIGAVWPWFTERSVGNSGFCLRSQNIMATLSHDRTIRLVEPEDISLCRDWRPYLEERHGIRFAPEDVADRFSVEHGSAGHASFGFHGIWNMLYFMDDEAVKRRLMTLERNQWTKQQIDTLGYRAVTAGRRELYRWINAKRAEVLNG